MSRHLAAALLVLAGLAQIVMATCGGGFGLFSTVDKTENRILIARVDGGELRVTGCPCSASPNDELRTAKYELQLPLLVQSCS